MNSKLTWGIVIIIIIIGGWLIYKRNDTDSMNMPIDQGAATVVNTGDTSGAPVDGTSVNASTTVSLDTGAGTTKSFTVSGGNYFFSPTTLSVNKGDTVTIHFVNSGGNHDFVIDEFNAKTPVISSGQTADVTFVADKSGTFEYYCSVGDHRAMGMVGTLTVK